MNAKHIPYTLPWDDAPIDLSFLYEDERPAGKHGFLTAKGNKLVFEDGTEGRFWGTNFNSGANFPSHESSEKVALRLAKFGINIVRFHQLDAEWSTPNIFQFTRGKRLDNTLELDKDSMERLDYLIYCLKEKGIYVYMDMLTYRKFKTGDGVENANSLNEAAKPYSNFNRRMIELQKKFNYDLWTHYNPYTGLAYKDDPVFVMTEVTNENELFNQGRNSITIEPYKSEIISIYHEWAEKNGIDTDSNSGDIDLQDFDNEHILKFLCEMQENYYREIIDHLRETGVRIPVTGTNWSINIALAACQRITDFTDTHPYWWYGDQRQFFNGAMVGSALNYFRSMSGMRIADKPLFISEWDEPYPNEWRAESPLILAAIGAFQGWSGFSIHTYRYNTQENVDRIGRDIVLGSSYYRGMFDTFNDPAKFGLFYHAALLLRRGDVREADKKVAVRIKNLYSKTGKLSYDELPALSLTTEKHKVSLAFDDTKPSDDTEIIDIDKTYVDKEAGEVLSDTEEIYRNWDKKTGWIDTPRTKVVYGFHEPESAIKLNELKIKVVNDFATIAMSSLTDDTLSKSDNILLTAVGRADNSDASYVICEKVDKVQVNSGHGPIMIEVIEASVEMKTEKTNLRVWSVNPEGFLTGVIPSVYEDGVLKFKIGKEFASMYYLIQEQ